MRIKTAQSSIEFIIMVGFLMTVFVLFFVYINNDRNEQLNELENSQIKEIGLVVKNEIDLASESSDGYTREFVLPPYEFGSNYTINITDDLVFVASDDVDHQVSYALKPVIGNINQQGVNVIRKVNGEVRLNV